MYVLSDILKYCKSWKFRSHYVGSRRDAPYKLRGSANSPMLVQPGKYKRDANLGSGRAVSLSFFSPPALSIHYSSRTGVCVYYWRKPSSLLVLFWRIACRFLLHSLATVSRLRDRFNLPRRECVDTGKYSGVVWSDDEWRNRLVEGLVKEELARGSAGKSAEADETTFFPPPFRPRFPFATCTSLFPVYSILLLLKIVDRVLSVRG